MTDAIEGSGDLPQSAPVRSRPPLSVLVPVEGGPVSGLLLRPAPARALLVFGHGAGAGMRHPFMEAMAERLSGRAIASLRYQFPYMERRSGRPDAQPLLTATVHSALAMAEKLAPDLPRFAGGKSMGGRMTSLALAGGRPVGIVGLVFFGFPLHGAGRRDRGRADHLRTVDLPMLFLQGTRDHLAALEALRPVVERLGPRAVLHAVEGADHGFHVLRRSGRSDQQVLDELAVTAASWMLALAVGHPT